MAIIAIIIVFILIVLDIEIIKMCINRMNNQKYFQYFNKNTWMVIVIFGSVFGQLLYVLLENS